MSHDSGTGSIDELLERETQLLEELYADSTKAAKNRTRRKVIAFNRKHYSHMGDSVLNVPVFWDTQTASGTFVSAARNARIFFDGNSSLKQATLVSMKSHLNSIYRELCLGLPPWDLASNDPEAPLTHAVVNRIIKQAEKSQSHTPLEHSVLHRVLNYLVCNPPFQTRLEKSKAKQVPVSDFALAACLCIMRGTGGRAQEISMLYKSYVQENRTPSGLPDGLNIMFPMKDKKGKKVSLKGKTDAMSRFKVIPETLDDGIPVSQIIRDYLVFAPSDDQGPLFQTFRGKKWSGKAWTSATITSKLRATLRKPELGLNWKEEMVRLFSAHGIRSMTASSMSEGGEQISLVASTLGHSGTGVTMNRYVRFSKERIRKGLAVTGTVRK